VLVRHLEAAVFPREYLDEARGFVSITSLQRHPRLLVDQSEFSKRWPMTLEQRDEVLLTSCFQSIGTDNNRLVGLRHTRYLALALNEDQDLRVARAGGSELVPPAGFEPTAPGLGILCSIHLS
jgi:hypothetical protein